MTQATATANTALAMLKTMVSIADSTIERVAAQLTLTQFRALRVITERTPVTMTAVARELDVNPSSVTRACDRLLALHLLQRARNPLNKRETLLAPTTKGRQTVARVDHDRRAQLTAIMARLSPEQQAATAAAFDAFLSVASRNDGDES